MLVKMRQLSMKCAPKGGIMLQDLDDWMDRNKEISVLILVILMLVIGCLIADLVIIALGG